MEANDTSTTFSKQDTLDKPITSPPPPAISIPEKSGITPHVPTTPQNVTSPAITSPHSATSSLSPPNELKNRKKRTTISDQVTEISPTKESLPDPLPGSFVSRGNSFTLAPNPFDFLKSQAKSINDPIDEILPPFLYGQWYHNSAALFLTAIICTILAKLNAGFGVIFLVCLLIAIYYRTSVRKYRQNTRNDIQREISKFRKEADEESVEWMNNFMHKFWLIFEPVLSALIVENVGNLIADYLPPFLESIRFTTFTLGSKPFRIETVKTYLNTDPDTVCMDARISFIPSELSDLTKEEEDYKVNPKIMLKVNLTKGIGFPVVLEDLTFSGHIRLKIKFIGRFPFAKLVEASFLEKPDFDYVLKPVGTDSYGLDVNVIPGLSGFVREQVHNILGPMMYLPNVFTFDVEKFFAGDFDLNAANGVLAVTVYSADDLRHVDELVDDAPDTYIRFYLDHGQELDRTGVCEHSFSPAWNETKYLKLNNLNSLLSLELNSTKSGFKDKRLGTASFNLAQLDDAALAEQEGLNLLVLRDGKQVSDLRLDIRYLPISKPSKGADGTIVPAAESNSGVLRLTIHECRDLVSTNDTVSPYVRIIVQGVEKTKTSVIKKTTNPKYEEPTEVVVLDKDRYFVRAEVRDAANEDELLGVFTSYLKDMARLQETNESWWDLLNGEEKAGQLRLSAEWKPVAMSALSDYAGGHGFEEPPIGIIRFTFWEAHDLRNVEMVTNGKSDPYVRVLSGHQVRARTEVKDNDLNPEWGETVYVPVHSLKENFVLETMDWNAKTRDKSLGSTEFKTTNIVRERIGDQSVNPDVWYESTGEKYDKWAKLRSLDKRSSKGSLHYSAEFFPVLAMPNTFNAHSSTTGSQITSNKNSTVSATSAISPDTSAIIPLPLYDLNRSIIKYTPDDLVALNSYNCGILKIKIHEVQFSNVVYAYCQVVVDALLPLYKTTKLRGVNLQFNECADAFIKEADFSRIAIEIKSAHSDEKDSFTLGHWIDTGSAIIRRIMKRKRSNLDSDEDDSFWFNLMGTDGPARIRLSFDYTPLSNFVLNPDESLDNQGILNVDLLSARDLKAADKSGTSDPYVVFTVNGIKVHKSDVIRKTLNPKWKGERFSVQILSRVTASIRIEVFDWNQVQGHQPIGSGGITIRGDGVESFQAKVVDIPLDGVSGVSGSVQVRFTWQPQLLAHKKTQTSVLGTRKTYLHTDVNLEASGPLQRKPTGSRRSRSSTLESSSMSPLSPGSPSAGRQSFETSSIYDDNASIATSSIADLGELSDTTGKPGIITVTLLEARGLRGVDKSGTSDPYVRVKGVKGQIYKTKVIFKSLTPEWNETFTCGVGREPFLLDFKVKDHNKIKSAVELGVSRVNIWDLIKVDVPGGDTFNQWLPLFPPGSGELLVNVKFSPTM